LSAAFLTLFKDCIKLAKLSFAFLTFTFGVIGFNPAAAVIIFPIASATA